jgi:hypothetical protein
MHPRVTGARRASVLLSITTLFTTAQAETLTYGVDAGVGETDNVTLAHQDKISQTIAVTDFDFDYLQKSQRLDAEAKGNFSYLDYLQNAYGSQLLGRLDGTANLALIPQRLTWSLQEDFGEAAIDPFTPTTPTNLENINYVATGPDLHLKLGGLSFVDASARVAESHYETSPLSSMRGMGSLAWGLQLSALSSVSVNVDSERVLFENTVLNTDFELTNAFVRYELQGARTELSAELGDTVVDQTGKSTGGSLAKFNLSRKLSSAARISLTAGRDSTDASASFAALQPGATGVVGAASTPNVSESYSRDYASVAWEYQRNRTSLALSGRWEKDEYAGEPSLNHTMTTGELRVQRQLRQAFTLQITGRLYKADYGNVNLPASSGSPDTQTSAIAASLNWHPGRTLELKVALEHTTYTTSPYDMSYRENRVFITVGYFPFRASPGGPSNLMR